MLTTVNFGKTMRTVVGVGCDGFECEKRDSCARYNYLLVNCGICKIEMISAEECKKGNFKDFKDETKSIVRRAVNG